MLLTAGTTTYMDSETSAAFAKVLEYIVNSLGNVVENTAENGSEIFEYLKELGSNIVAYKAGLAWLWMVVAGVCVVFAIISLIIALVKDSGGWLAVAACAFGVALTIAMINGYQLVECYTFPEKTVIEFIREYYSTFTSTGSYR